MKMLATILWAASLLGLSAQAQATLILNGQGTSAYGTYNLIYDTDLNITWYDYTTTGIDRRWVYQNDWANNLTVDASGTAYSGWRLPIVSGCYYYNCKNTSGEMAHLYYVELGNVLGGPLTNSGPFQNLDAINYWSGTERLYGYKYTFNFSDGVLGDGYAGGQFWAYNNSMAVHPGNVSGLSGVRAPAPAVPEPEMLPLFGTGLAGVALVRSRKRAKR